MSKPYRSTNRKLVERRLRELEEKYIGKSWRFDGHQWMIISYAMIDHGPIELPPAGRIDGLVPYGTVLPKPPTLWGIAERRRDLDDPEYKTFEVPIMQVYFAQRTRQLRKRELA